MKSIEEIEYLCGVTGYNYHTLLEKTRKQDIVFARYMVMNFFVKNGMTLKDAGRIFDKDHTTAIHGINTIKNVEITGTPLRWLKQLNKFNSSVELIFYQDKDPFIPFIQIEELCGQH
jgi:hypothetical protein